MSICPICHEVFRYCPHTLEEAFGICNALRAELELSRKIADEAIKQTEELTKQLNEWEEKEAACCPEDFGFEEVIESLRTQLDESNRKLEQRIAMEIDEHLKVVELQNQMDMAWEGLDDIIVMELPDEIRKFTRELMDRIEQIGGMNVQG
jgi:chromosome segregation ATPase